MDIVKLAGAFVAVYGIVSYGPEIVEAVSKRVVRWAGRDLRQAADRAAKKLREERQKPA